MILPMDQINIRTMFGLPLPAVYCQYIRFYCAQSLISDKTNDLDKYCIYVSKQRTC